MSDEEMAKHLKELETINSLKIRQYYLTTLNKTNQINNHTNGSANIVNQLALAHDFLESDFRDKLLDIEEQIYNGSLGSIKVKI
jgi:uncharacterized protein YjcR